MQIQGAPFRGEVNSADASSGVTLALYKDGSLVAYTLLANEYLEIHSIQTVTAPGGDVEIFIGADVTPAAGEYIVRGTFAANGGVVQELVLPHTGRPGHLVRAVAPAGALDVIVRGTIRTVDDGDTRPAWREALPGN